MSIASERLACDATTLRLTEAERQKLCLLFQPAVRHLSRMSAARLGFLSVADGEDIVQEAFVSFARQAVCGGLKCLDNRRIADIEDDELDKYVPYCRTYLIQIAERKCSDFQRKTNSHLHVVGRWCDAVREQEADPAVDLIRQEQVNDMRQAVMRLPERLREVLVLRFHEQYTEEEIAATLKISVRTVQRHLHDILVRLRALLQSEMAEDMQ